MGEVLPTKTEVGAIGVLATFLVAMALPTGGAQTLNHLGGVPCATAHLVPWKRTRRHVMPRFVQVLCVAMVAKIQWSLVMLCADFTYLNVCHVLSPAS